MANLGDFTNQGSNMEYDHFAKSYEEIRSPKFTVIGNHDALGAGLFLFDKMLVATIITSSRLHIVLSFLTLIIGKLH